MLGCRFIYCPEYCIDEYLAKLRILEIIRVTKRGVEDTALVVGIGPGNRLRLVVGDGACKEQGCCVSQRAGFVK